MPTLEQWEKSFSPYFERGFRVLGEIPLSQAGMDDITWEIRRRIHQENDNFAQASRILIQDYPHTFLVYLTAFGAYNSTANFWGQLGEALGVGFAGFYANRWPQTYREWLQKRGFRVFQPDEVGDYYVATIRMQGGIPAYSLPDFFARLVLPSVRRPEYTGLPARQVLAALMEGIYNVDAPVINFLENSGDLGIEYFSACRDMAVQYDRDGTLLSAEALKLPEYVVDAFGQYMETEVDSQLHLHKPMLYLLPDQEIPLILYLPPQEMALSRASGRMQWVVRDSHLPSPLVKNMSIKTNSRGIVIDESEMRLDFVPSDLTVELATSGGDDTPPVILRKWALMRIEGGQRLLAFSVEGLMLNATRQLPAGHLVLVYPTGCQLAYEGGADMVADHSREDSAWRGWQIQTWDLSLTLTLWLTHAGQMVGNPVSITEPLAEPKLRGSHICTHDIDTVKVPLYTGVPPEVIIPLRTNLDRHAALREWKVEVDSVGESQPVVRRSGSLNGFEDMLRFENDNAVLPLNSANLLGVTPVGTYRLTLTRSGEVQKEFVLRCLPKMTVAGIPQRLLPGNGADAPLVFTLILPQGSKCEPRTPLGAVKATVTNYGWTINAGPDIDQVDLTILVPTNGLPVGVPVSIPIPRLRWGLVSDPGSGEITWGSDLVTRSIDALLTQSQAAINIRMHGLDNLARYSQVELVEAGGQDGQQVRILQVSKLESSPLALEWFRVSLSPFYDTLSHENGLLRFDLVLAGVGNEPEQRIPLLSLSRKLDIQNVRLEQVEDVNWRLQWVETMPLHNRWVMIEPAWRPWQGTLEYKIPDEVHGDFLLEKLSLPPSRYHVYFYLKPSWELECKQPPEDSHQWTKDLVTAEERLAELEGYKEDSDCIPAIQRYFEMACIYYDLGRMDDCELALSKIATQLNHCTSVSLILGLFRWLEKVKIQGTSAKFLRRQLYNPKVIQNILDQQIDDRLRKAYLDAVPLVDTLTVDAAALILDYDETPEVMLACLKVLSSRQDLRLIPKLLALIERTQLSASDGADVLKGKEEWAIEIIERKPPSPSVDKLLAELLKRTANVAAGINTNLVLRIIPYESAPQFKLKYVELLVQDGLMEGYQWLELLTDAQSILRADIELILSLKPNQALEYLEDSAGDDFRTTWMDWMVAKFPSAAGFIVPGSRIMTPFGELKVDTLEDSEGVRKGQTRLSNEATDLVRCVMGEKEAQVRVTIDLGAKLVRFDGANRLVMCRICGYLHPDMRAVTDHHNLAHHHQSLSLRIDHPAEFEYDDISEFSIL